MHDEIKTAVWMFKLSALETLMKEDLSDFKQENQIPIQGACKVHLTDHPDNYAGPMTERIAKWIRENILLSTTFVWIEVTY